MGESVGRWIARVPWVVWAGLLAAAIIGALQLWRGGKTRVPVVGAGPVHALRPQDAPPWAYFEIATRPAEPHAETRRRVAQELASWPDVMVIGLDEARERAQLVAHLEQLARAAENATTVAVLIGPRRPTDGELVRFRRLCDARRLRVCVVPAPEGDAALRRAVWQAVVEGLRRQHALRVETYGR